MPEFNPNRLLHGNGGAAWWNGKKLTTLQKAEAKVTGDFEDINVCGDPATYSVYNGYSGEGTLTVLKIDSDVLKELAEAYNSGEMPEITVVTSLTQKGTNKVERVAYSDVTVDEFCSPSSRKRPKPSRKSRSSSVTLRFWRRYKEDFTWIRNCWKR